MKNSQGEGRPPSSLASDICCSFTHRTTAFMWHLYDFRDLFFAIGEQIVRDTLLSHKGVGLTRLYRSAAIEGYGLQLLSSLDKSRY